MYDNTPPELDELIDQCRALIYAIVTLDSQQPKEILSFVLWQKMDMLYEKHQQDINESAIS
ncbi:hypothetical protein L9H26_08210 [Morganella psychrotolerans]|uniref:Prophage protein n=1 Tax=Morganella psychrotolerans TaxID=368603 RepID=A0A5M9R7L4_9GAMM|nr:hypothetical protein [Morganella psychrotolerans]KAA8716700.1 hypothetical protein F4V73_02140 [Morganella psychrotolerans]OBU08933.1 hypothetical protein AYY16_06905 [Morganella psychrotolerans]